MTTATDTYRNLVTTAEAQAALASELNVQLAYHWHEQTSIDLDNAIDGFNNAIKAIEDFDCDTITEDVRASSDMAYDLYLSGKVSRFDN